MLDGREREAGIRDVDAVVDGHLSTAGERGTVLPWKKRCWKKGRFRRSADESGFCHSTPNFFDLFSLCHEEREIQNGLFGDDFLE